MKIQIEFVALLGLCSCLSVVKATADAKPQDPALNSIGADSTLQRDTPTIYNASKVELTDDLESWVPPSDFQRNFPYYLSGFDDEDQPIWIIEIGKYNFRDFVLRGKDTQADLSKYLRQLAYRVRKSRTRHDPKGKTNFILDFEGLSFPQFSDISTIAFILQQATDYSSLLDTALNKAVLVNANYVTEALVNLVRPIFGRIFANVEIYGTNRAKWLPLMLRHFPQDQLPEYYGGIKGFKPYKIYG